MKKSALIIHSKHTELYALFLTLIRYKGKVKMLEISSPPTKETSKLIKYNYDIVIGVGGGSVIDTAKIIANPKRCIAIPTTASGASVTPYATIWGENKESIKTAKPILKMAYDMNIKLPYSVISSTLFDALSHALESLWSKNSTFKSRYYAKKALKYIKKYVNNSKSSIFTLIKAGNYAGEAIAITKTNVIHAISYSLTIKYGIDHGLACGLVLPYVMYNLYFNRVKKVLGYTFPWNLFRFLDGIYPHHLINLDKINPRLIAELAMKYDKINDTDININKQSIIKIIEMAKRRIIV